MLLNPALLANKTNMLHHQLPKALSMAIQTMATAVHRLCWPVPGQIIPNGHACTFKICQRSLKWLTHRQAIRLLHCDRYLVALDYPNELCLTKWPTIYLEIIFILHAKQWHMTYLYFTIHSNIQTFKPSMKVSQSDGRTLQQLLADFLMNHRITPHAKTKQSSSSLLLNRTIRSRLTFIHLNSESHVFNKKSDPEKHPNQRSKTRSFEVGQTVMPRNFRPGNKREPGKIDHWTTGPNYLCHLKPIRV